MGTETNGFTLSRTGDSVPQRSAMLSQKKPFKEIAQQQQRCDRLMNKIQMRHSNYMLRFKTPEQIQAMVQQYEDQIDQCSPEGLPLLIWTIQRLKNLVQTGK
jgi:hypothetical protein